MATTLDPANATTLDSSTTSATLDLFRAVLGPIQTNYYLKAFTRFDAKDRGGPSWNWAAGLLTLNWMALYRLWGAALAYVGAVLTATLLVLGIGRLAFGLSEEAQWLGMGVVLALSIVVPGVFGNAILYNHCRKKMDQALTVSPTLADACDMLRREAPSRQRVIGLGIGNGVFLAGIVGIGIAFQGMQSATVPTTVTAKAVEPVDLARSKVPSLAASASTNASTSASAPNSDSNSTSAGAVSAAASAPVPPASASASGSAVTASAPASTPPASAPAQAAASAASASAAAAASAPPLIAPEKVAAKEAKDSKVPQPKAVTTVGKAAEKGAEKATESATKKAAAKAEKSPAKEARADSDSTKKYVVNVGLFADENNARNAASKLSDAGIPVLINEMEFPKGKRTRVRAGPFSSQAEAERAVDKIHFIGLDAEITRK